MNINKISYKINRIYLVLKYGFLWQKPNFLLKLAKNNLIHRLNLKKTFTLRSLCLAITYACNYNCPHCLTKEMMKKRAGEELLQLKDYERIAKESIKMGAISFAFQGGEIWMHKDFNKIIKLFQPKKHYITVTTNGTFVSKETLKELAGIGVNKILFSLESGISSEHDRLTGMPGGFETTMMAIKTVLAEKKSQIGINVTLSRENLYSDGFRKLVEFCNKHKILLNVIFGCALGNWKEYRKVMLSKEDIEYYNKNIVPLSPFINRHLNFNYNGCYGCPAAKETFYINPWGDVLACPFNHTFFGNLKKDSLKEIRERAFKVGWFNHIHPRCLVSEEKVFMDAYYPQLDKSQYGYVDYKYWLKNRK